MTAADDALAVNLRDALDGARGAMRELAAEAPPPERPLRFLASPMPLRKRPRPRAVATGQMQMEWE